MPSRLAKHWQVYPPVPAGVSAALAEFPPYLRQLLYNRGISEPEVARQFLERRPPEMCDPFGLTGMRPAVERIFQAIDGHEPVAVYGDYDVDGVTATALLVQVLQKMGGQAREYIPSRFDEGYGVSEEGLRKLKDDGVHLVITVDCGIRSWKEAETARLLGMDMVITDHHNPLENCPIPNAVAVINPKQPGDLYPEKNLAGVGVAFKLAQALYLERYQTQAPADEWLDLAALGTVADLAPLLGENRSIVASGLGRLRAMTRQGPLSLAGAAGLRPERVRALTATDIGFILAPRLNAAGRLDTATAAYELLMTPDFMLAGKLAQDLNDQNSRRRQVTREIVEKAREMALRDRPQAALIFAVDESFSTGVVGLAASNLVEAFYRPAIVGTRVEDAVRCSCRSISEFHITRALDECADLLDHHGGHAMAAGFTVREDRLPALLERLEGIAQRELGGRDLRPGIKVDLEVGLDQVSLNLYQATEQLQPTGYANPEPLFVTRGLLVKPFSARKVGDGQHLKLKLTDGRMTYDAIAFRMGDWLDDLPTQVDVVYALEINEWNGRRDFQLNVKDLKASGVTD